MEIDKEFNELISKAAHYLEFKLFYSPKTVYIYKASWKRIGRFMLSRGIKYYSKVTEQKLLQNEFNNLSTAKLSPYESHFLNSIKMLSDFQETGKIAPPANKSKYPYAFEGTIGRVISDFLDYKKTRDRISKRHHCSYQRHLSDFLTYCNKNNISSVNDIKMADILHYIGHLNFRGNTPISTFLTTLRGFLKFAFDNKLIESDYSTRLPRYKSVIQPKLPSTYSKAEIERLIFSIDRSSPIGKRNYAIIMLVARLGLRASDVSRLQFENLHWITSTVEIKQFKTGKELILPLLPDVGNAIVDYLKYGRPKSEESYVFLAERPPYGHFATSNVVTHVVRRAFIKARIDIKGRRSGPHSLRHSLGFRMLKQSTILPVISEVLGHGSTESTKYYLRIDLQSMKQCMLDVPPVSTDFYEQKGGAFYE